MRFFKDSSGFLRARLLSTAYMISFLCTGAALFSLDNVDEEARIAVLEPKGINIPQNQMWLLSMIQSSLTNDFHQFSTMAVLDRQYLDTILAEQNLAASGSFSDKDYIRIGNLTQARYILVGSLTKGSDGMFILDLAITDPETGKRAASFGPKRYTEQAVEGITAAKDGAYQLLKQMGVSFNNGKKKALYETALPESKARAAAKRDQKMDEPDFRSCILIGWLYMPGSNYNGAVFGRLFTGSGWGQGLGAGVELGFDSHSFSLGLDMYVPLLKDKFYIDLSGGVNIDMDTIHVDTQEELDKKGSGMYLKGGAVYRFGWAYLSGGYRWGLFGLIEDKNSFYISLGLAIDI